MSGCWSRGSCVGRETADDKLFMLSDRIIKSIIIIKITTTITTTTVKKGAVARNRTHRTEGILAAGTHQQKLGRSGRRQH